MSFVLNTSIPGEAEYLFAPYSVFKLVSVKWGANNATAHQFVIKAAIDNMEEDEELPLAPWY